MKMGKTAARWAPKTGSEFTQGGTECHPVDAESRSHSAEAGNKSMLCTCPRHASQLARKPTLPAAASHRRFLFHQGVFPQGMCRRGFGAVLGCFRGIRVDYTQCGALQRGGWRGIAAATHPFGSLYELLIGPAVDTTSGPPSHHRRRGRSSCDRNKRDIINVP